MKQSREWLLQIRHSKKKTQQEVADSVNIKRTYYTQIEKGSRNPSVATAKKIANALGFEWTIFFQNTENPSSDRYSQRVLSI